MKTRRLLFLSVLVVALLVGGCGLWVWQAKRQYALNRQLIAALLGGDTKQALAVVNRGADPNTPVASPPAPTLRRLASQLLYRSLQPDSNDLTAFRLACGRRWFHTDGGMLHWEYFDEDLPLLQAMLTHGANVHAKIDNSTALHDAVPSNRLHTVELLLNHGANVNAQDKRDTTPLMLAGIYDNGAMVHLLLSHGANPNVQNVKGNTVLHMAVVSPVPQRVIPELLVYKADINLPNKQGETPLTLAQQHKRPDLVALLRKGTILPVSEITLIREPGIGLNSPFYALTLRRDGSVTYAGSLNAPQKGTYTGTLPITSFAELAQQCLKEGFATYQPFYGGNGVDSPVVTVSIVQNGKRSTVEDRRGATWNNSFPTPNSLRYLQQQIDAAVYGVHWVKRSDKVEIPEYHPAIDVQKQK